MLECNDSTSVDCTPGNIGHHHVDICPYRSPWLVNCDNQWLGGPTHVLMLQNTDKGPPVPFLGGSDHPGAGVLSCGQHLQSTCDHTQLLEAQTTETPWVKHDYLMQSMQPAAAASWQLPSLERQAARHDAVAVVCRCTGLSNCSGSEAGCDMQGACLSCPRHCLCKRQGTIRTSVLIMNCKSGRFKCCWRISYMTADFVAVWNTNHAYRPQQKQRSSSSSSCYNQSDVTNEGGVCTYSRRIQAWTAQ